MAAEVRRHEPAAAPASRPDKDAGALDWPRPVWALYTRVVLFGLVLLGASDGPQRQDGLLGLVQRCLTDPNAAEVCRSARSRIRRSSERPPHHVVDLGPLEGELAAALLSRVPLRRSRAQWLLCTWSVAHGYGVDFAEGPLPEHMQATLTARLLPLLAASIVDTKLEPHLDCYACLEAMGQTAVSEPESLFDRALAPLRRDALDDQARAPAFDRLNWKWRGLIQTQRHRRDRPSAIAVDGANRVEGGDALERCAASLRGHPVRSRAPNWLGDSGYAWPTRGSPPVVHSPEGQCFVVLSLLDCTAATCEQHLMGDRLRDAPLAVRRLNLTIAILAAMDANLAARAGAELLTGRFIDCGDSLRDRQFCTPAVRALIADGVVSEAEAERLLSASLLAWEFVDRPAWLKWP